MSCSAGSRVPWLGLSTQDVVVPFKSSKSINLTYRAEGLAAGTYRAQLCLFGDYSYGNTLYCCYLHACVCIFPMVNLISWRLQLW